jgi:hypothetical protein
MIPKSVKRFSEAIMPKQEKGHDPEKCEAAFGSDHAQTREGATDLIQRS